MNKKDVMRQSVSELKQKRYNVLQQLEREDISPKRRRDLKAHLHRLNKDLSLFGIYREQYLKRVNS